MYNTSTLISAKSIKEDLSKWRDIPHSLTERFNILRISILSKVIYRFNTILIQFSKKRKGNWKAGSKISKEMQRAKASQGDQEQTHSWKT